MDTASPGAVSPDESCNAFECLIELLKGSQFWYGVLAGAVIALIIVAIWKCYSVSGTARKVITIEDGEKGSFSISVDALAAFVRKMSSGNPGIEIWDLRLAETRLGLVMIIVLKASIDAELVEFRNKLREKLIAEMKSKLGIGDQIKSINFEIREAVEPEKQH